MLSRLQMQRCLDAARQIASMHALSRNIAVLLCMHQWHVKLHCSAVIVTACHLASSPAPVRLREISRMSALRRISEIQERGLECHHLVHTWCAMKRFVFTRRTDK
jgi:hypothetical protein